jgi:DNA-binding response OmpR family regulator
MTPTQIADALVTASARTLDRSRLLLNAPLAPYTTFRIGGPADVLFEAHTADELATAITAAKQAGIPWFVLGLGANVLIGDRGIRGLVIRNTAAAHTISPEGKLWTESGAVMQDLVLDTVRQEVRVHEKALDLTAFEFKVLEYLMHHHERVVSKTELTEHIYEQDFDRDSNTIEVFVGRLRRKLPPGTIDTLRGLGYRLALPA